MSADRPINADVPPPQEPEPAPKEEPKESPAPPKPEAAKTEREPEKPKPEPVPPAKQPRPPRARKPKPLTPKLLALLVVVAVLFIVVAIIGGTGGGKEETTSGDGAATTQPSGEEGTAATAAELGFPGFATNNPTRVGGADPAANAAAVALAVYPSTSPSQRPDSVTLVDEDNWAAAIAAASLMAPPVRAPILFGTRSSMPTATEEALAALDPKRTNEVTATSPAAAAAELATLRDKLLPKPPAHIVIAPEDAPEFAMPAAAWAARSGDPVLFAGGDDLPPATVEYLEKHTRAPIYVLGPAAVVSSEILREAEQIGGTATRVGGEDPVANAIAFARYGDDGFGWNINDPGHGFVLVREDATLNAAAAAPLSGSGTWGPLLLTDSADTLPNEVRDYFLDVKPGYTDNPTRAFYNHVWVIGDQEAIDLNQQAEVNELAELEKIGGGE
ncbi:MAG: hypothetical protein QOE75_2411 [Solirubrobacterales bacterium]|nr:hypothetical protein [Solirubrobacterales bacterium]